MPGSRSGGPAPSEALPPDNGDGAPSLLRRLRAHDLRGSAEATPERRRASGLRAEHRVLGHRTALPASASTLLAAVVLAGIALRLIQYAADRSLWFDEALLALNILHRPFGALGQTLDFRQAAPLGFLYVEKLSSDIFQGSEDALRLFPLVCGVASMPLFALAARRYLPPRGTLLATALFAVAAAPIYYASEVKQYSGDLAASLLLLVLALALLGGPPTRPKAIAAAVVGAAVILVSHAAIFVAAGVAFVFFLRLALRRDREALALVAVTIPWGAVAIVAVVLASSQAAYFETFIGPHSGVYAQGSSAGGDFRSVRVVLSGLTRSAGFGDGHPDAYLRWPLVALGLVGLVRLVRRRPEETALLVVPVPFLWAASALHKYPLFDRTVLFVLPAALVLVSAGIVTAADLVPSRWGRRGVAAALAAIVLAAPVAHAAKHVVEPVKREEIRAALEHVRERWRPGDALFVDGAARFAFRYYLDCGCLSAASPHDASAAWRFGERLGPGARNPNPLLSRPPSFIAGANEPTPAAYLRQLRRLRGRPRVWILYTHTSGGQDEIISQALSRLARSGRLLYSFDTVGAHAYLYDLRTGSG